MRKKLYVVFVGTSLLPFALGLTQRPSPEAERATQAYRKGWEYMRIEAFADAAKQFQEAINIDRRFTLAYYSLGRAHMNLKQFVDAIKDYTTCKAQFLARAGEEFASQMEADHYREEQLMQYREALRQATATPSGPGGQSQTQSQYVQGLQSDIRRLEQARQRNTTNLTLAPSVPFYVSMSLGAAYFRLERFTEAEREYKEAIAANPNSGETHNNLAVLYLVTDRINQAASEIGAAEKAGYVVNPALKEELKQKKGKG